MDLVLQQMFRAADEFLVTVATKARSFPGERELERKLQGFFSSVERQVLRELRDKRSADRAVAPIMGGLTELDEIILDVTMRGVEDNLGLSQLIKDSAFQASRRTLDRMTGDVKESISRMVERGDGINKIAQAIREDFEGMADFELKRIARTETHHVANIQSYDRKVQAGIPFLKWITAKDGRVRDSHQPLNGQIVRTGNRFQNGLKHPGDRTGPIDEWISCRCQTVAFIMPSGRMAPTGMEYFYESDLVTVQGG